MHIKVWEKRFKLFTKFKGRYLFQNNLKVINNIINIFDFFIFQLRFCFYDQKSLIIESKFDY